MFRGGPTFPALFLGAAAAVMASHLPGFSLTPAVAVAVGVAVAYITAVAVARELGPRVGRETDHGSARL